MTTTIPSGGLADELERSDEGGGAGVYISFALYQAILSALRSQGEPADNVGLLQLLTAAEAHGFHSDFLPLMNGWWKDLANFYVDKLPSSPATTKD